MGDKATGAPSGFPNLTSEISIGPLALRNRMVMPPMGTGLAEPGGMAGQRMLDYYEARAAGGAGLVIVENASVDFTRGNAKRNQLGIDGDHYLLGLSRLAQAIKRHGSRAMIQLNHAGREALVSRVEIDLVAPSALPSSRGDRPIPRALAGHDIEEIIQRFIAAAERAQEAGFDGVEAYAAHSFLLSQFLSPLSNVRDDLYGGSLANRARIVLEVIRGIKKRISPQLALGVRFNGDDYAPGGRTIEESCQLARWFEDAGADFLDISGGGPGSPPLITVAPARYPNGFLLSLAQRVKAVASVPVIGVGRISTPWLAEAALREGKCDLIAIGRGLIADPDFPNKVASGRAKEIRPCVACMVCVETGGVDANGIVCSNNPSAGRERDMAMEPAAMHRRVVVIGGGVAGMQAAQVAARRGHHVTLFEQGDRLGGQLIAASVPPHKHELQLLLDYYLYEIEQLGVHVRLGSRVNADEIVAARPDAVIVATGSLPRMPDISGIDRDTVVMAEDVLLGRAATGVRVVVIGGELVACETAEYLAEQGKQVTVVRRGAQLASKMYTPLRNLQLSRLAELSVEILTGIGYEEVNERGLLVRRADGTLRQIEADTVVIAAGADPANELAAALEGRVSMLRSVGDAAEPRRFINAIHEGTFAALAI